MDNGELLLPRFLLPVRPEKSLLTDHAVRVCNGVIDAVLPAAEAIKQYPLDKQVRLDRHVLMPGLINMHTHSPMTLMRGMADDISLKSWLEDHIWPTELRWADAEFVRDGTRLALTEMLRGGVTCFNEMYFFPDVISRVTAEVGMRAAIGIPVIDVKTQWASGLEECVSKGEAFIESLQGQALQQAVLAPHAPYTVDDAGLRAVRDLAEKADSLVAMHLLETGWESGNSKVLHGCKPLQRLEKFGLLNDKMIGVHMVHPDEEDIELLAATGTHVVHCPESNLKLASGISPVAQMQDAGINVSLGTDGAASNNNLDLLGEARTAALLAKGVLSDPCALDAWTMLDMLTINAARALGWEAEVGSIEAGKQADLAAMNLDAPETQPLHQLQSQLIYSASSRQFTDVWVGGCQLLQDGETTTINWNDVLASAEAWNERMRTSKQSI